MDKQTYDLKTIIKKELGNELSKINASQKKILMDIINEQLNDSRLTNLTTFIVEQVIFHTT